jgi:hypothetical protein
MTAKEGVIFGITERGGSSSRRAAISSSRPPGSTEVPDSSRSLSSKMVPISLRTSGTQRGSPVASAEPKRTGGISRRNSSSSWTLKEWAQWMELYVVCGFVHLR